MPLYQYNFCTYGSKHKYLTAPSSAQEQVNFQFSRFRPYFLTKFVWWGQTLQMDNHTINAIYFIHSNPNCAYALITDVWGRIDNCDDRYDVFCHLWTGS